MGISKRFLFYAGVVLLIVLGSIFIWSITKGGICCGPTLPIEIVSVSQNPNLQIEVIFSTSPGVELWIEKFEVLNSSGIVETIDANIEFPESIYEHDHEIKFNNYYNAGAYELQVWYTIDGERVMTGYESVSFIVDS